MILALGGERTANASYRPSSRLSLLSARPIITTPLTQTDRRRLEAFEMGIWRKMEKVSWPDRVINEEVLRRVN